MLVIYVDHEMFKRFYPTVKDELMLHGRPPKLPWIYLSLLYHATIHANVLLEHETKHADLGYTSYMQDIILRILYLYYEKLYNFMQGLLMRDEMKSYNHNG